MESRSGLFPAWMVDPAVPVSGLMIAITLGFVGSFELTET